jgi:hypothetical protein
VMVLGHQLCVNVKTLIPYLLRFVLMYDLI